LLRSAGKGLAALLLSVAAAMASPAHASAQGFTPTGLLGVEETEDLARRLDYEGLPESERYSIGPEGGARLLEMLGDPAERPSHARILLLLGDWGGPGAFEALRDYASQSLGEGELDRDRFRAWQALPFAFGRLAPRDPRAVAALSTCFDAAPPAFSFRHFRGDRLQALERRAAVSALVETRLPEADRVLDDLMRRGALEPGLAEHVREARAAFRGRPGGAGR
jgi:hypothetical protein